MICFSFILGLFWHLLDSDNTTNGSFLDGQTGFPIPTITKTGFLYDKINYTPYKNLGPMIQLLESDVRTGFQLKVEDLQNKPWLSTEITNLFSSYGY